MRWNDSWLSDNGEREEGLPEWEEGHKPVYLLSRSYDQLLGLERLVGLKATIDLGRQDF